jgi:hypothetical protein
MSKRYKVIEVLEMWDEIPVDGQDTEESSSDDEDVIVDGDYIRPCDADEPTSSDDDVVVNNIEPENEEIIASEASTTAMPKPKKKVAERVTPSAPKKEKTLEKLLQKLELVEPFLLKSDHLYPLTADQVKSLQKITQFETKEKLSVAQVKKLVEIARRQWKKIEKPSENHSFAFPEGPNIEFVSECHTPADVFFQYLHADIVDNIVFQTNLYINQRCHQ